MGLSPARPPKASCSVSVLRWLAEWLPALDRSDRGLPKKDQGQPTLVSNRLPPVAGALRILIAHVPGQLEASASAGTKPWWMRGFHLWRI